MENGIMDLNRNEIAVPVELMDVLQHEKEALEFFQSLSVGYKRGYCDWVGGAKNEDTRKTRAEKALLMLRNKQKTLLSRPYRQIRIVCALCLWQYIL
jgi:uncharacterized protein YdeI (YjbR/CyaY-like superfamily)